MVSQNFLILFSASSALLVELISFLLTGIGVEIKLLVVLLEKQAEDCHLYLLEQQIEM